jgi:hypothetical protein
MDQHKLGGSRKNDTSRVTIQRKRNFRVFEIDYSRPSMESNSETTNKYQKVLGVTNK